MGSYTTRELERDTGFGRRTIAYYVQEGLLPRVGRRGPRTRYPELVRDRLLFIRRVREAEAEAEIAPVRLSDLRELFLHAPRQLIASVAAGETPVTSDIVSPMSAERRSMVDRVSALRERLSARREAPADDSAVDLRRDRQGETLRTMKEPPPPRLEALGSPAFPAEDSVDYHEPPEPREEAGVDETEPLRLRDETRVAGDRISRFGDSEAERVHRVRSSMGPDDEPDTLALRLSWVLDTLQTQARRQRGHSPEAVDTWSQVEVTPDIRLSVRGMGDEDAFLLRSAARLLRQTLELEPGSVERSAREREE